MSAATATATSTTHGGSVTGGKTRPVLVRYQAGVRYIEYVHDEGTCAVGSAEPASAGDK